MLSLHACAAHLIHTAIACDCHCEVESTRNLQAPKDRGRGSAPSQLLESNNRKAASAGQLQQQRLLLSRPGPKTNEYEISLEAIGT